MLQLESSCVAAEKLLCCRFEILVLQLESCCVTVLLAAVACLTCRTGLKGEGAISAASRSAPWALQSYKHARICDGYYVGVYHA